MDRKKVIKANNNNKVVSKKIKFCSYCQIETKKLVKCSGIDCDNKICKQCITYIQTVPFCPSCVLDIVQNKVSVIILKEKISS